MLCASRGVRVALTKGKMVLVFLFVYNLCRPEIHLLWLLQTLKKISRKKNLKPGHSMERKEKEKKRRLIPEADNSLLV